MIDGDNDSRHRNHRHDVARISILASAYSNASEGMIGIKSPHATKFA